MKNTGNKNPVIQEVNAAMKATKDKRMFERYQTILLHLKGVTYEKIAVSVGRSMSLLETKSKPIDGVEWAN